MSNIEYKIIDRLYSSEKCCIELAENNNGELLTVKDKPLSMEVIQTLKQVHSPYIARLVEGNEESTVFEYVEGTPLNEAKVTPDMADNIFLQLCSALEELHRYGIIHRDIKPSNIILCNNGNIRLIDFDAARIKKPAAEKDTSYLGTDGFAPPEQFGFSQTDERSDIYALGVTMQLLLGKQFQRYRHRRVVEKCMHFNPEDRYPSAVAVRKALRKINPLFIAIPVMVIAAVVAIIVLSGKPNAVNSENTDSSAYSSTSSDVTSVEGNSQSSESGTQSDTENSLDSEEINNHSEENIYPWEAMSLPVGFPELTEYVESYYMNDEFGEIVWQNHSPDYTQQVVDTLAEYLVTEPTSFTYDGQTSWDIANNEFHITVYCYFDYLKNLYTYKLTFNFRELTEVEFAPSKAIQTARIPTDSVRSLSWEELDISDEIPRLTDSITKFTNQTDLSDTEGKIYFDYVIEWDSMSTDEAALIAEKLYQLAPHHYYCSLAADGACWSFNTEQYYIECNLVPKALCKDDNQAWVGIVAW